MPPRPPTHDNKAGLAHWAQRTLEECDNASHEFAADPVHDLRVAIRRCRSMADGFLSVDPDPAWKEMKRLGKALFSSLGDLRDVQVMLEWVTRLSEPDDPVRLVLLETLGQKESQLKAAAQEALHNFNRKRWTALNARLAKRAGRVPVEGLVFQHLALERWMDAHALHRQALRNRTQVGYHRLRIGIKRFRYTCENFLPQRHEKWAKDLRELQDALGEVHDFDVLKATIKAHPGIAAEDRERWNKRIAEERQQRLDLYRQKMLGKNSLWPVWRDELPRGPSLQQAAMEKLRTWASFLDPDVNHSAHVTRLALQLYDGLAKQGIVIAEAEYRRILEAAAMLHEVGRSRGPEGHRKRAYSMIRRLKPPLGWSAEELQCVAVIARYHGGALPQTSNSAFVGLTPKRRRALLPIAGILRLADAFDFSHDRQIDRVAVERRDGMLIVYGRGLQEISPVAERVARARYLLETTCACPIMVRPQAAKPAAASPVAGHARKVAAGPRSSA
ncbi:MAG: CHAD domain-containing protein [Candidatus Korobacteraceae bacterium]